MKQEITLERLRKLAEETWQGCHHCDENDRQMWINGFIHGYLIGGHDEALAVVSGNSPYVTMSKKRVEYD
jgi:dTDP-4-dehydrorhamnose 3,5-epimerase-like enzyme